MRKNEKTIEKQIRIKKQSPSRVIASGFLGVILVGAILLTLPISSRAGVTTHFVDALLTATSATCVTGLIVKETHDYWSLFGQITIITLIQIGGLGFMTMASLVALISGKRFSLQSRILIQESFGENYLSGVVRLLRHVVIITFTIEAIGALALSTVYIPEHGWLKGIYFSVFQSISAFCNAGFDLNGGGRSAMDYVSNPTMNITIMLLIIFGGIGFTVILDMLRVKAKIRRLTLHSKMVLMVTGILILSGALLILLMEYTNPTTIGELPLWNKIMASFFHSISPRTAGLNTLAMDQLRMPTVFLIIILMFIGGSPSSTAGGIKTTTFGLMFLSIVNVVKGKNNTVIFNRKISKELTEKATAIVTIYLVFLILATMTLSITDGDKSFINLMFEVASALGTVGHTINVTSNLSIAGKLMITFCMFIGRIGPLTLFLALTKANKSKSKIEYPEGRIMVG